MGPFASNFRMQVRSFEVAEADAPEARRLLEVRAQKMTSRREFVQLATRTTAAAMLASSRGTATEQKEPQRPTPRSGLPLLNLQQRFLVLRFAMFVHFNMAPFHHPESADPPTPPTPFPPPA